jgi:imidazolonepropionase-like amidohydrolase
MPRFCYTSKMLFKSTLSLHVFLMLAAIAYAQDQPVVIRAGSLFDGKGGVQHNAEIIVQGGKIQKIAPASGKPSYDLRSAAVLPGMIDTHVHIAWHFGPDGRYQPRDASQTAAMGYAIENAYVTLMGGFTTVQSVGSPSTVIYARRSIAANCRAHAC